MTPTLLKAAQGTDMGRRRTNNEDLGYLDEERGIFIVIDGVGGHAAGEKAAETALDVIKERLERATGEPELRLREAIALANNEIYRLAGTNPDWSGMACVLTVALVEDGVVHVGHVGDSRLYLLQPGSIRKITHDHSPVGEREDRGELSEQDAMRHPRRNEIFRDVGSEQRTPDDPNFIDTLQFEMPRDGALLLCSDGLTDLVEQATIAAGMELYAPDYDAAIAALIRAANDAGGKDNITIVVAAGPDYGPPDPAQRAALAAALPPPAKVAEKPKRAGLHPAWIPTALIVGMIAGSAGLAAWNIWNQPVPVRGPQVFKVPAETAVMDTVQRALPGDSVVLAPGTYVGRVTLKSGVALRGDGTGEAVLTSEVPGPVVVAENTVGASLEGVTVRGTRNESESVGIDIAGGNPEIRNVRVERAFSGIVIRGASTAKVLRSSIAGNLATGIEIRDAAHPTIENNIVTANGKDKPGPEMPGIEIRDTAQPLLRFNAVFGNGAEPVWIEGPPEGFPSEYKENFFAGPPPAKTHKIHPRKPAGTAKPAAPAKPAPEGKRQ
jgi:serine/threonine protein phosphatase PrpC